MLTEKETSSPEVVDGERTALLVVRNADAGGSGAVLASVLLLTDALDAAGAGGDGLGSAGEEEAVAAGGCHEPIFDGDGGGKAHDGENGGEGGGLHCRGSEKGR